HGAGREVGVGLRDGQRAVQNIEGLDRVADVDDLRLGSDSENDAFHGADEMIVESEISSKSDDRNACQYVASSSLKFSGTQTKYRTLNDGTSRRSQVSAI